ncbi:universal stress protein [Streptomyces zinciresistens K42]|uniref:Universal stress protein n=1 Tax=Streptomyces zinciresistens K42 TaxID=700597 RepID=G2GPT4_9ACTN|nr:universal stress protein [Streptomyces zinciresistens]EGX54482.1 universal stress protein [Streptomyces zinciresistens K42]
MAIIVVGVDGSPASLEALRWALDEARLRAAALRVVHAWSSLYHGSEIARLATEAATREPLQRAAEQTLDAALAHTPGTETADIERRVVEGPPTPALIEAAQGADLLVVGSRGRGGFASLLLGSVSHQCAQHAPCPIVIVHT